jgi:hypothetical protein
MGVRVLGRVLGTLWVLGTLLAFSACQSDSAPAGPISRDEYIDIYVEILRVADESPDSVTASERALAILRRRGVSEDDLLAFAHNHMEDPQYLVDIWSEIEERLRNPEPADTADATEPVESESGERESNEKSEESAPDVES